MSCATPGSLPTVGCVLLQSFAGADMILVNYKGNAPALTALMAGEINLMFDLGPTVTAPVKSGRVRAVATAFPKRGAQPFSDLPAVSETIPGFDLTAWQGVVVPAGTPREIIGRLNAFETKESGGSAPVEDLPVELSDFSTRAQMLVRGEIMRGRYRNSFWLFERCA